MKEKADMKKSTKTIWLCGVVIILLGVLSVILIQPSIDGVELKDCVVVSGTILEQFPPDYLEPTVYLRHGSLLWSFRVENIKKPKEVNVHVVDPNAVSNLSVGDIIFVTTDKNFKDNMEVGRRYKFAVGGGGNHWYIFEKGNLLWDSQSRKLKDFLVGTYQRNFYLGFPTQLPEGNPLLFYSIPLTIILFFTLLWAIKESFITKLLTTLFVMLAVMPAITLPVPYDLIPFLSIPIEIIAILFAIKLRGKYKGVSHKSSD